MLFAVISLTTSLLEGFFPPQRTHKGVTLRRLVEVALDYAGYSLTSPIEELDRLVYVPSNVSFDEPNFLGFVKTPRGTRKGIPNQNDYGYNCAEILKLCLDMFQAKIAIEGKVVQLRAKNDNYWRTTANYSKPSVLKTTKEYNTEDLKPSQLFEFEVDTLDENTIENYQGTTMEVRTELKNISSQENVLLKGYNSTSYNVALGSRKNELNPFENIMKTAAGIVDDITAIFGSRTRFASSIQSRVGMLVQSSNETSLPKLLWMEGNKLPKNHREKFSAETLYDKYQNQSSFVLNNFGGQKEVYKNEKIPFGLDDFMKVLNNGYFNEDGIEAGILKFEWIVNDDFAVMDYFLKKPYTKNLTERKNFAIMEHFEKLRKSIKTFAQSNEEMTKKAKKQISEMPDENGGMKSFLLQSLKDAKEGKLDVNKFLKRVNNAN